MEKNSGKSIEPIINELVSIKQLLVFGLIRSGASQSDVANALGLHQSNISRMFPNGFGETKKLTKSKKSQKRK